MTTTSSQLLAVLSRHIGADNGIRAADLARELDAEERHVRTLVTALRDDGCGVCAHPKTGYFIAANAEEMERYYLKFIEARCMTGLRQIARARKIALPDLIGQLKLPT